MQGDLKFVYSWRTEILKEYYKSLECFGYLNNARDTSNIIPFIAKLNFSTFDHGVYAPEPCLLWISPVILGYFWCRSSAVFMSERKRCQRVHFCVIQCSSWCGFDFVCYSILMWIFSRYFVIGTYTFLGLSFIYIAYLMLGLQMSMMAVIGGSASTLRECLVMQMDTVPCWWACSLSLCWTVIL